MRQRHAWQSATAMGLALLTSAYGPTGSLRGAEPKPLPYPPTAVSVVSFDTDKVLYDEGQKVVFRCALRCTNAGPSLCPSPGRISCPPLVVQVWDEHGLDKPVKVAETKLDAIDPDGPTRAQLTWTPGTKRYGHRAHVRVLDGAGRRLARATTLYEVCRDWQYVIRFAATAGMNVAHDKMTDSDLQRVVDYLRQGCANTLELYAPWADYYDLTPDGPTWKSAGYPKPKHPRISGRNIKRLGQLLHKSGMHMVFYNETSVIDPQNLPQGEDPETYRVYWRDGQGKLHLHAPYYKERGWFMPNALKIADRFQRELVGSVRQFGWDGLLADSATEAFFATANGFDKQGHRLTQLTPGQVGVRHFGGARRAVLPINPRFRFICQNLAASCLLRHYHWREPDDRIEQVIGNYMRKHYGELFDVIDAWSAEMDPHYGNQKAYPQTYDKYAHVLNIGREVSRKPILLWMHVSNPHIAHEYTPEYARPLLSVLGASRVSWHDHFSNWGGWWGPWNKAPVNRVQVQLHRFLARFGKYLRAPELRWVRKPSGTLRVTSARGLLWERSVYQREYDDGVREVTVNLINLDSPLLRPSNKNKPPHVVPPVAFPVTVTYRVPQGAACESVVGFVADAEDPDLKVLELRPEIGQRTATFRMPPIRSWHLLVIRHQRTSTQGG